MLDLPTEDIEAKMILVALQYYNKGKPRTDEKEFCQKILSLIFFSVEGHKSIGELFVKDFQQCPIFTKME